MASKERIADELRRRVRAHRERMGWTQTDLSNMLVARGIRGMTYTTIAKIEAGTRSVHIDELAAMAEAFGASTDALLGIYDAGERSRNDLSWTATTLQSSARDGAEQLRQMARLLLHETNDVRYYAQLVGDGAADRLLAAADAAEPRLDAARAAMQAIADAVPPHATTERNDQ